MAAQRFSICSVCMSVPVRKGWSSKSIPLCAKIYVELIHKQQMWVVLPSTGSKKYAGVRYRAAKAVIVGTHNATKVNDTAER